MTRQHHQKQENKNKSNPATPTDLFCAQRPLEQPQERSQTESVHIIDFTQITNDEVQTTSVLSQWFIR